MLRLNIFFLIGIFIIAGCAGPASTVPDWVNGNSRKYPANQFLLGKGQAQIQNLARDRARADLAKIFEVSISESSEDKVVFESSSANNQQATKLDRSSSRYINSTTNQIISGIEISETWKDIKSGEYYALATLDRIRTAQQFHQLINQLDNKTSQEILRARNAADKLVKAAHADQALQAQQERALYQKQLKIIDPAGIGLISSHNITTLLNDRNQLLGRIRIYSFVKQPSEPEINRIIRGAVSKTGFTDQPQATADYVLESEININQTLDTEGWYWQKGFLQIVLKNPTTGKVRGSRQWPIKTSSQDRNISRKRVIEKIDQLLTQELRDTLLGFGVAN